MNLLSEWQNFFVVVGSAAGALTGLQFVTMALVAEIPLTPDEVDGNHVFATPTMVYFSTVLFLAAALVAPWHSGAAAAILWGSVGVGGFVYTVTAVVRIAKQEFYKPVLEDWIFRAVLPLTAWAAVVASAVTAHSHLRAGMFMLAAALLLLSLIGIHNAWDNVTYIVLMKRQRKA